MFANRLKREYPDLIRWSRSYNPYEVIDFQKFIERFLQIPDAFYEVTLPIAVRQRMRDLGLSEHDSFTEKGQIFDINFLDMVYYQPEVGINGPWHSQLDDPVHLVQFEGKTILWNGYHRSLANMLNGRTSAQGYMLSM
jgi:hypothetical protein